MVSVAFHTSIDRSVAVALQQRLNEFLERGEVRFIDDAATANIVLFRGYCNLETIHHHSARFLLMMFTDDDPPGTPPDNVEVVDGMMVITSLVQVLRKTIAK
jgi:hypothetical protein